MNRTKIDHICEKAKDAYFLDRYKFAEYIVRECLNNMENCDGDIDFAIFKTKQDFGIK